MTVISRCAQGNLTCARAAELLDLSPRHIKRLKARYRQGSAAALAHVSRDRPSHCSLPERTRIRILALARTRYTGFNDHHLHDKLVEQEGLSLSREPLPRRLQPPLRALYPRGRKGLAHGSGKSRSHLLLHSPAHRQQRQCRAMGPAAAANSSAAPPLQLCRSHRAGPSGSQSPPLALLPRYSARAFKPRGRVTFLRCR